MSDEQPRRLPERVPPDDRPDAASDEPESPWAWVGELASLLLIVGILWAAYVTGGK